MSNATYTVEDILRELDACAADLSFPMLDNGYIYLGDVRMSAYADARRWAILFEILGFHYRYGLPRGIETDLFLCGIGLPHQAYRIGQVGGLAYEGEPDEGDTYGEFVPSKLASVKVRGRDIAIPREPASYAAKGIEIDDPSRLRGQDLMRVLLPEHREAMLANDEERRRIVPPKLPLFARLDEWHHPDIASGELVSESSTFQNLAIAMVALEPNMFGLTDKPNTHWRNWPMSGAL